MMKIQKNKNRILSSSNQTVLWSLLGVVVLSAIISKRAFNCICFGFPHIKRNKTLSSLVQEDQRLAMEVLSSTKPNLGPMEIEKHKIKKQKIMQKTKELYDHGRVCTADDFRDASIIFLHGDSSADYLFAYKLGMEAFSKNSEYASSAVNAYDRYLVSLGFKQIFGTQLLTVNGTWCLHDISHEHRYSDLWWQKSNYINKVKDIYKIPKSQSFISCSNGLKEIPTDLFPRDLIKMLGFI